MCPMSIRMLTATLTTVSALVATNANPQSSATNQTLQFSHGSRYPQSPISNEKIITQEELETYRQTGYILKKGIVSGDELDQLISAGKEIYSKRDPGDERFEHYFRKLSFDVWQKRSEFAKLAFERLPSVAAELLEIDHQCTTTTTTTTNTTTTEADAGSIRLLKDGFFGLKQNNNRGCGFHVDDAVFWPATYETTGVNFWIALSPMRASEGGGIRVVDQNLIEPLFEECRHAITQGQGYPPTCEMERMSPKCHQKMLESSTVFDMEPGDALIWDRWTFHKSEPFSEKFLAESDSEEEQYRMRYTIRYVPGHAKADGRHHQSQKRLEVFNTPFYPRVWPDISTSEIEAIQQGLEN